MKFTSTLFLFILLQSACKNGPPTDRLFTMPGEWPIPDSNCNKLKSKFKEGYIEFFSINKSKFRFLKNPTAENFYDLQVFQKGKWTTNLNLTMPRFTFNLFSDIDLDNYFDLTFMENDNIVTYFFDKSKGHFDFTPLKFSYDYALLDSSQLIYGTNTKTMDTWNIDIFSIKNRTQNYLLTSKIHLLNNANSAGFEITKALIYKCNNGLATDTILIDNVSINKQFGDFSLRNFMKELANKGVYR